MHIFFDLDGTITDSSPGIVRCINHALTQLGHTVVPEHRLRPFIGAPLVSIFASLLESEDDELLDRAVAHYRERFNVAGIFENSVYPGIEDALRDLSASGYKLQIVTVKPAVAARRVLEHFRLAHFFAAIHGPTLDERTCDKADYVAAALSDAQAPVDRVTMVGDRIDDIRAARRHGVKAVAVAWGYGTDDELLAATPAYLARTVSELVAWLKVEGNNV